MGMLRSLEQAANTQSAVTIHALLLEQQETNRLLRKLAGERQPEHEASDTSWPARAERKQSRPR